MAGAAIGELGQLFRIISSPLTVTIYTPTHVDGLWVLSNLHFGHIAVTSLTVQPRSNVRAMCKMDKVWDLSNRHPGNILIVQNIIF
jgi:hypothetical protein